MPIIRVKDVYGRFCWLSKRHFDNGRILIPICTGTGEYRSHIRAGEDKNNMMHRENIAEVRQTRE